MPSSSSTLEDRAYKTAKARFNASDRLIKKQKSLIFTITLITIAQISASVAFLAKANPQFANLISSATINFSVFIAIISNTDSLSKDVLSAHHFHECGLKLMELTRKISGLSPEDQQKYQEEYNTVINSCSENHSNLDYKLAEKQIIRSKYICFYEKLHTLSAWSASFAYIFCAVTSFLITYCLVN